MKGSISPNEAKRRLIDGNERYIGTDVPLGSISEEIRKKTAREGQHPYAVIIACSDSRVVPEFIFSAGIGELFVIRVAGNVIDSHALGSVEYAAEHLGCRLVVVLGHSHCGAVGAALGHPTAGFVKSITDEILCSSAGAEEDENSLCVKNVLRGVSVIRSALPELVGDGLSVVGAVYDIESGRAVFIDE